MGAVPGWSWQLTLRLTLEVLAKWGGWWCHTLLLNLHYQWHLNKVVLILLMAACMSCSHYEAVRAWVRLRGKSESWVNCLFLQHTLAKETRKRCMYKFCLWMPLNSKIFRCFGTVPGYTPFQPQDIAVKVWLCWSVVCQNREASLVQSPSSPCRSVFSPSIKMKP